MTKLSTLTLEQVIALQAEAEDAGDTDTRVDCAVVYDAYVTSDYSDLSEMIDAERGAVRDAAERIVRVIRNAEAQ
jgi:hypothetical protein